MSSINSSSVTQTAFLLTPLLLPAFLGSGKTKTSLSISDSGALLLLDVSESFSEEVSDKVTEPVLDG